MSHDAYGSVGVHSMRHPAGVIGTDRMSFVVFNLRFCLPSSLRFVEGREARSCNVPIITVKDGQQQVRIRAYSGRRSYPTMDVQPSGRVDNWILVAVVR